MARLGILLGPLVIVLWVFCVIHVVTSRDGETRHLPRWAWLLLVLLFPLVGSVAWLAVGRPVGGQRPGRPGRPGRPARPTPYERQAPAFPEYDRPGRAAAGSAEADEEFLRRCRERAEEQRRRAAEQRRREQAPDNGAEES